MKTCKITPYLLIKILPAEVVVGVVFAKLLVLGA